MYLEGQGVPQDSKETFRLFRLSAEQGMAEAQYSLGVMYSEGVGVLQDNVVALMWLNIAGSNVYKDAVTTRNLLEKKMTPAQISEAQKLAREWMEEHGKE